MATRRKGKREIVVEGQRYLWSITNRVSEISGDVLSVVSEDKTFLCYYPLFEFVGEERVMIACGRALGGESPNSNGRREYQCPRWEREDWSMTPMCVARFIQWCNSAEAKLSPENQEAEQGVEPDAGHAPE